MNPIKDLIQNLLKNNHETRSSLIKKVGYKNINKGLRRLDNFLEKGLYDDQFLKKLSNALSINLELIHEAINSFEQKKKLDKELTERKAFHPHLWIKHELENPPLGSINIVGLIGIDSFKKISLPKNIGDLSWYKQIREIKQTINQNKALHGHNNVIFGKVIGYIYRKEFDVSFDLDCTGSINRIYSKFKPASDISLYIK